MSDDRTAILDVLARFCRGVDRLDEAAIADCFHDGAVADHGFFRGSGPALAAYIIESSASMIATVHTIGNVLVEFDGSVARVEAQIHVVMRTPSRDGGAADHTIHARYLDRFEQRGGVWRIAERLTVYDLTRIDAVGREWGLGEGFTTGRRDRQDPATA